MQKTLYRSLIRITILVFQVRQVAFFGVAAQSSGENNEVLTESPYLQNIQNTDIREEDSSSFDQVSPDSQILEDPQVTPSPQKEQEDDNQIAILQEPIHDSETPIMDIGESVTSQEEIIVQPSIPIQDNTSGSTTTTGSTNTGSTIENTESTYENLMGETAVTDTGASQNSETDTAPSTDLLAANDSLPLHQDHKTSPSTGSTHTRSTYTGTDLQSKPLQPTTLLQEVHTTISTQIDTQQAGYEDHQLYLQEAMTISSRDDTQASKAVRSSIQQDTTYAKAHFMPETLITSTQQKTMSTTMLTIETVDSHPEFSQRTYGGAKLGDDADHLIFSHPVQLTIPVDSSVTDGEQLAVYVIHAGDEKFNKNGLTTDPDATCDQSGNASQPGNTVTVFNGQAIIYTCGASTFVVTYTGGSTLTDFVDNASLTKTITVGPGDLASGTIQDINVIIDFHAIDGTDPTAPGGGQSRSNEVSMTLQSPLGTTVTLLNTNTYTNPAAPRVTVTFDDSAGSAPSGVPSTGTFIPAATLTTFNGEDPLGNWTFTISDSSPDDGVSLFSASLQINALECGDGLIEGAEQCDDGNTNNSDGCSSTCTIEATYVCSGEPSVCNSCSDLSEVIVPYRATDIDENTQTINYSTFTTHTYGTTPIVLATPNSQNNADNYPIPRISNITESGFDISICMDAGSATCDPAPNPEDIGIFVIDRTLATCTDTIDTGIDNIVTDGTNTAFTFNNTFTNVPYIYTTPQTSNQGNNIAVTAWVDNVGLSTAGGQFIGCSHQGVGNTCTAGTNEDLGWVAIDPILFTGITTLAQGTASIPDSEWTTILYASAGYIQSPVVMVSQNSELGAQDGKYPWARRVDTSAAQIRYCEPDGANYCDTHNAEDVRWFSLPVFACGDGLIDSSESCDDGNTTGGDGCSSSCQIEGGYTCSGEASVCTLCTTNPTPIIAHQVTALDDNRITVNYSSFTTIGFNSTPYIFATPNSQNNGDNYPIPRIRNVTTGGFDVSVCLDRGATTCDTSAADEDLAIFIVDTDSVSCSEGIQAGTINATTNGANTAFSFDASFTNTPYVFTTAQTSNQGNTIAAHSRVDDMTVLGANIIGCTHQGIGNTCDTGQPNETFAWLAIDPLTFTMDNFQLGSADISNSDWTTMNFSPDYTQIPGVMVTQNDDDGGEDGQYPRARSIGTGGGEFRYCEADAANVCNSHTSEIVRWFSLPFSMVGDICLEAPGTFSWSGSTIVSLPNAMSYEQQFTGYFTVTDNGGGSSGYYTTLELSQLSGVNYGDILPSSSVEWYATGVDYISGSINTGVVLASGFTSYTTASGAVTFIQRDTGIGVGITGTYGANPFLRITIPPYTRPDSYQGVITYTLYEN